VILRGLVFCVANFPVQFREHSASSCLYAMRRAKKDCFGPSVGASCVCALLERETHHLQPSLVGARKAKNRRRAISSSPAWFLSGRDFSLILSVIQSTTAIWREYPSYPHNISISRSIRGEIKNTGANWRITCGKLEDE